MLYFHCTLTIPRTQGKGKRKVKAGIYVCILKASSKEKALEWLHKHITELGLTYFFYTLQELTPHEAKELEGLIQMVDVDKELEGEEE